MEPINIFQDEIKKLRLKHSMTQKELAEKLHVTPQAVSKWERGESYPDLDTLKEICQLFNVDMNQLVGAPVSKKSSKKTSIINYFVIFGLLVLGVFLIVNHFSKHNDSVKINTIQSSCELYNLNGVIAYNSQSATLHISDFEYCGTDGDKLYNGIDITLKDTSDTTLYQAPYKENISINEYIDNLDIYIENYVSGCKVMDELSLQLVIHFKEEQTGDTYHIVYLKIGDCN